MTTTADRAALVAGCAGVLLAARFVGVLEGLPAAHVAQAARTAVVLAVLSALLTLLLRPGLRWQIALFSAGAISGAALRVVPAMTDVVLLGSSVATAAAVALWIVGAGRDRAAAASGPAVHVDRLSVVHDDLVVTLDEREPAER